MSNIPDVEKKDEELSLDSILNEYLLQIQNGVSELKEVSREFNESEPSS